MPGKRERRFRLSKKGYALLTAIIAVNIFAILALKARDMWEREIQRDLEAELIFRSRQYVTAIELYRKKNPNMFPTSLELLYEKKFIRKLYKDPMTEEGVWNVVMRPGRPGAGGGKRGAAGTLWIVPEEMLPEYITKGMIIGVCSSSTEEGYLVYRKKKKYCQWAIYLGEQLEKDMPELKFVAFEGEGDSPSKDPGDERGIDDRGTEIDESGRRERDERGRKRERERE